MKPPKSPPQWQNSVLQQKWNLQKKIQDPGFDNGLCGGDIFREHKYILFLYNYSMRNRGLDCVQNIAKKLLFQSKEYFDWVKLFFRRFVHNLPTIYHQQVAAEEYV
jgi:hypothetical protein